MNFKHTSSVAILYLVHLISVVHGNGLQLQPGPCPAPTPLAEFNLTTFAGVWNVLRMPRGFYTCSSCTSPVFNLTADQFTIRRSNTANEWLSLDMEWPTCPEEWSTQWNLHLIANPGFPGSFQIKLPWPLNSLGQARLTVIATDYDYYAAVVACWAFPFESISLPFLLSKDDSYDVDPILESRIQRLLLNQRVNAYDWESYPHANCPIFNSIPNSQANSLTNGLLPTFLDPLTTPMATAIPELGVTTFHQTYNSSSLGTSSASVTTQSNTANDSIQFDTATVTPSPGNSDFTLTSTTTTDSINFSDNPDSTAAYTHFTGGYTTTSNSWEDPKGDAEWITTDFNYVRPPAFNPNYNPNANPGVGAFYPPRPGYPPHGFPGAGGPEFPQIPFYYPPFNYPRPSFPMNPGFGRNEDDENIESEVTGDDAHSSETKASAENDQGRVALYPLPPDPIHGKLAHIHAN